MSFALIWPFARRADSTHEDMNPALSSRKLFGQSLLYIQHGDFAQAKNLLHQLLHHLAIEHQTRLIDAIDYASQRARVCSELANLYLLEGSLDPAEALLKQTVQDCVTAGLSVTSAEVVELSLKLALIYERLGRDDDANTGFLFCITTQEQKERSSEQLGKVLSKSEDAETENLLNEGALLGMCCNHYARFLYSHGDTESALHYAEQSLQAARRIYPPDHPNCLHLLSSLGIMHANLEEGLDQARAYLKQAYDLAKPCFDACQQGSPDKRVLANSLLNILVEWAVVEARAGEQATAGRLLTEAEAVLHCQGSASLYDNVYRQRMNQVKSEYSL